MQTIVLLCLPLLIYFPWAEAQSAETEGSEGRMKKKKKIIELIGQSHIIHKFKEMLKELRCTKKTFQYQTLFQIKKLLKVLLFAKIVH